MRLTPLWMLVPIASPSVRSKHAAAAQAAANFMCKCLTKREITGIIIHHGGENCYSKFLLLSYILISNLTDMLHSYIAPSKKPQTSKAKKAASIPCADQDIQEVVSISIAALVQQAKNEGRAVTDFLKSYITVEEVGI